jgi:hypothetical protein
MQEAELTKAKEMMAQRTKELAAAVKEQYTLERGAHGRP